jgi:hypothetical protein
MALVYWDRGRGVLKELATGHPVDWLAKRAAKASWTAIDAPFGWPDRFIKVITEWAQHRGWPADADRRPLRYRLTDLRVSETKYPLSVSSDRIGSTAMVCAHLLEAIARARKLERSLDRTGADRVIECYPAAAMKIWKPDVVSFKGTTDASQAIRRAFLEEVVVPKGWLVLESDENFDRLVVNEDLFDALICSLMARAASKGANVPGALTEADSEQIKREGWIHMPVGGSLNRLAD